MKKAFLLLFLFLTTTLFAQKEAAIWYFGEHAGLDFNNTGAPPVLLSDGQMQTYEGCASIADSNGNLLFYVGAPNTSASVLTIWDASHTEMSNGTGLLGNVSATQAAMIAPLPGSSTIYYVFTVGALNADETLHYSVIDMTLNGGLGDVISGQKNIQLTGHFSEKITAVRGDGDFFWIITYGSNSGSFDTFYVYKLDSTGLNTTAITSPADTSTNDGRGYLKISSSGTKIALATTGSPNIPADPVLNVYNFNNSTGVISNKISLNTTTINGASHPYGLEFSLSGDRLYTSFYTNDNQPVTIKQYDLTTATPNPPSYEIASNTPINSSDWGFRSALQMAIDGKIYATLPNTYTTGTPKMAVINNPEADAGTGSNACGWNINAIDFSTISPNVIVHQGFPPFIQSFFNVSIVYQQDNSVCEGNTVAFSVNSNQTLTVTDWNFGDGSPIDSNASPTHTFPTPNDGLDHTYTINLHTEYVGDLGQTESQDFTEDITIYAQPTLSAGATLTSIEQCDDNNDGFYTFDLHTLKDTEILGLITAASTANFQVRYFPTEADLDADTNEITTNPYTNVTTYNETLWVRVENTNHIDCYAKILFDIHIYDTPTANSINDMEDCDNNLDGDDTNGSITWDLTTNYAAILGAQDATIFEVFYYASNADFLADIPIAAPAAYANTSNPQTITAAIRNRNNTTCIDSTTFNLTVNPLPTLIAGVVLKQCDEDNNPNDGLTVFNLNEANSELVTDTTGLSFSYFGDPALTIPLTPQDSYTNLSNPQTIYALVTNTTTNCSRSISLNLEVSTSQLDTNLMVNLDACDDDGTEDGFHLYDLQDASATILATLPAGQSYTVNYYATLNDAQLEQNALPITNYMSTTQVQGIYVRVDNAANNDCFGIGIHVNLTTNPLPQPVLGDFTFCINIGFVTIDASINDGNTYSYSWNTGETTAAINATTIDDYTVTVTNTATSCTNTAVAHVTASSAPDTIDIIAVDNSQNNSIEIIVTGIGDYEYSIDNGLSFFDTNYFDHLAPGFYDIVVQDKNGCGSIYTMKALVGFPAYFTPNADGFHDYWRPQGILNPGLVHVKIFDRYGKLLKTIRADSAGWDGIYNGKEAPSTDYWFLVKLPLPDGRTFRSHFALKR